MLMPGMMAAGYVPAKGNDGRAKFTERAAAEAQAAAARAATPSSAAAAPAQIPVRLAWCAGDKALWNGYTGMFLRNTVDSQVEALIGI